MKRQDWISGRTREPHGAGLRNPCGTARSVQREPGGPALFHLTLQLQNGLQSPA